MEYWKAADGYLSTKITRVGTRPRTLTLTRSQNRKGAQTFSAEIFLSLSDTFALCFFRPWQYGQFPAILRYRFRRFVSNNIHLIRMVHGECLPRNKIRKCDLEIEKREEKQNKTKNWEIRLIVVSTALHFWRVARNTRTISDIELGCTLSFITNHVRLVNLSKSNASKFTCDYSTNGSQSNTQAKIQSQSASSLSPSSSSPPPPPQHTTFNI